MFDEAVADILTMLSVQIQCTCPCTLCYNSVTYM